MKRKSFTVKHVIASILAITMIMGTVPQAAFAVKTIEVSDTVIADRMGSNGNNNWPTSASLGDGITITAQNGGGVKSDGGAIHLHQTGSTTGEAFTISADKKFTALTIKGDNKLINIIGEGWHTNSDGNSATWTGTANNATAPFSFAKKNGNGESNADVKISAIGASDIAYEQEESKDTKVENTTGQNGLESDGSQLPQGENPTEQNDGENKAPQTQQGGNPTENKDAENKAPQTPQGGNPTENKDVESKDSQTPQGGNPTENKDAENKAPQTPQGENPQEKKDEKHEHEWDYNISNKGKTGKTITATCVDSKCDENWIIELLIPKSRIYDGNKKEVVITNNDENHPYVLSELASKVKYTTEDGTELEGAPVNAGTYKASLTLGEGAKAKTATITFDVTKKSVNVNGITAVDREYEQGNTGVTLDTSKVNIEGLVEEDNVSVSAVGTMADDEAGQNKPVNITDITLAGDKADNYTVSDSSQKETTVNINKLTENSNPTEDKTGSGNNTIVPPATDNQTTVPPVTDNQTTVPPATDNQTTVPPVTDNQTTVPPVTDNYTPAPSTSVPPTYYPSYNNGNNKDVNVEDSVENKVNSNTKQDKIENPNKVEESPAEGEPEPIIPGDENLSLLLCKGIGGNHQIKLTWLPDNNVDGYDIFGTECYTYNFKLIKGDLTKLSYTIKNLKNSKAYKYYVKSYKLVNGEKVYQSKSAMIHVAMTGQKCTNVKTLKVNKSDYTLSAGKTATIKASVKKENSKKPYLNHASKYRYFTDNKKIATVSKSGEIKAKSTGNCKIYVLAENGVYKTVKVTVK